jgi:hypothetical protein
MYVIKNMLFNEISSCSINNTKNLRIMHEIIH